MTRTHFAEAFSNLKEAVKHQQFMLKFWKNWAWCAGETGKYDDAMYAQHQLLDFCLKHNHLVDYDVVAWIVDVIVIVWNQDGLLQRHYKDQIAKSLDRNTSKVTNDSKLWQVCAYYNDGQGRQEKVLEWCQKASRTLQMANWGKAQDKVERLGHATLQITVGYQVQDTNAKQDFVTLFGFCWKEQKWYFCALGALRTTKESFAKCSNSNWRNGMIIELAR